MENFIVLGIIVVILGAAIASTINRKRKGACCSGGGGTVREKKELNAPKIGEIEVKIEGMHCENCRNSIERKINRMEGVVCKVNLRKKLAVIEYSQPINSEDVKKAIEVLDFKVLDIITR